MSLNGLDSPAVQDAYQAAIAEAGGWFLLRYTSRDAVELLEQGRNGVSEARKAITTYPETSPLYGLLMYRRRKIIIKHIPEGTSRLLQARTTVHLSDILERYSPYETLLEISSADALNDTALAASFQLHTASRPSPSPLPSSSRLDEICEDGEDTGATAESLTWSSTAPERVMSSQRYKTERRADQLLRMRPDTPDRSSSLRPSAATDDAARVEPLHVTRSAAPPLKTSVSQFLVRDESGHTSVTPLDQLFLRESGVESWASNTSTKSAESPHPSHDLHDSASLITAGASESTDATEVPSSPERVEDNSANQANTASSGASKSGIPSVRRPSTSSKTTSMDERSVPTSLDEDPYDIRKYDEWFKPKVKLGPRPVATPDKTKRPAVARVSALPANFKTTLKKQEPLRPKTSTVANQENSISAFPIVSRTIPITPFAPPPIPDEPEYTPRPVSRGSIKSATSYKSTGLTPDKLRLMKAIEHRKRQLRQAQEQQNSKANSNESTALTKVPEDSDDAATRKTHEPAPEQVTTVDQPPSSEADSGIEMRSGRHDDQERTRIEAPVPEKSAVEPIQATSVFAQSNQDVADTSTIILDKPEDRSSKMDETIAFPDPPASSSANEIPSSRSMVAAEHPISADEPENEKVEVPTIVMADGSAPDISDSEVQDSGIHTGESDSVTPVETAGSPRRQNSDVARRRRGYVEPLGIDVSGGNPDDFVSDDDELLEELQSATVQEAKHVMVARNMPSQRPSAETEVPGSIRSVNITRTIGSERLTPDVGKMPMSPTSPASETGDPVSAVSRNVSSGISKRIQALAEMSNRPSTPESAQSELPERGSRLKIRPASYRKQSGHRGLSPIGGNLGNESIPVWNAQPNGSNNRNSVSVTARIVRPGAISEGSSGDTGLLQSELKISQGPLPRGKIPSPINTAKLPSDTSSPALSPALSWHSGEARQMHSGSFLSRHKGPASPGLEALSPVNSSGNMSSTSLTSNDGSVTPKEGGRTSRFFKRMSNMSFTSGSKHRKDARSSSNTPTIKEDVDSIITVSSPKRPDRMSDATDKTDMPPPVVVGDLNVQFPDSLLWKRRIVTVDESGNLQFAIAQAMEIHKGVAWKHFPLVSLRQPYAPDIDAAELPHSMVLELLDGMSLQLACEDAMTQRQVLHLLQSYWKAWNTHT